MKEQQEKNMSPVIRKCSKCNREYTLGVNGIVTGCDNCKSISRACNGYALDDLQYCSCLEYVGDNPNCPIHIKA